jgi:hypothetical protein
VDDSNHLHPFDSFNLGEIDAQIYLVSCAFHKPLLPLARSVSPQRPQRRHHKEVKVKI